MGQVPSSQEEDSRGGARRNRGQRATSVKRPPTAEKPIPRPSTGNSTNAPKDLQAVDRAAANKKIEYLVKSYTIRLNSTGHTYDSLFSPFMGKQLTIIRIDEPYTSSHHQINNIIRFVECCAYNSPALKIIKLVTREGEDPAKQRAAMNDLTTSLKEFGIRFLVEYRCGELHDRQIIFNNGHLIKLGRGLDIYQRVELKYHIGMMDFRFRKCKETTVDVFKCSM